MKVSELLRNACSEAAARYGQPEDELTIAAEQVCRDLAALSFESGSVEEVLTRAERVLSLAHANHLHMAPACMQHTDATNPAA